MCDFVQLTKDEAAFQKKYSEGGFQGTGDGGDIGDGSGVLGKASDQLGKAGL